MKQIKWKIVALSFGIVGAIAGIMALLLQLLLYLDTLVKYGGVIGWGVLMCLVLTYTVYNCITEEQEKKLQKTIRDAEEQSKG